MNLEFVTIQGQATGLIIVEWWHQILRQQILKIKRGYIHLPKPPHTKSIVWKKDYFLNYKDQFVPSFYLWKVGFFPFKSYFYFMCNWILSVSMSVLGLRSWSYSCELPCGCWELNLGPLEEQSVLLAAEPSAIPSFVFFFLLNKF